MAPDAVVRSVDELGDGHASFRVITFPRLQQRILIATSRGSSLENSDSTCVSSPDLSSPLMRRALMRENSARAAAARMLAKRRASLARRAPMPIRIGATSRPPPRSIGNRIWKR